MTKKDYEMVAAVIRDEYELSLANFETITPQAITSLAESLAKRFALDNERFSPTRFLSSCGVSNV